MNSGNKSLSQLRQESTRRGEILRKFISYKTPYLLVFVCNLVLFLGFTSTTVAQPGTITTVVGTGVAGYSGDGGPAISARINSPRNLFVDGAGNLYIADRFNHCIRKMTPSGIITTVAGTGVAGFSGDGGPATAARLREPTGVVMDGAGNLYFADHFNHRIRKVDIGGIITTVAGTGVVGFSGDGGLATAARLNFPAETEVDAAGNLYIADQLNDRVRKVNTSGIITTVAGTGVAGFSGDGGPATAARLHEPIDLIFDGIGNLYVADYENQRVRKVDTGGIITTVVGTGVAGSSGDGGLATVAQLNGPIEVELDGAGNLYIVDIGNNRVRKVNTGGIITTVAGTSVAGFSGDGGLATAAQLDGPNGAAVDGSGNLYIADRDNHRIRKVFAAPPIPNAGADQVICVGAPINLGAIPAATGGTPPYSFNWTASPSDPSLASPTDENPTVSPTVTTTYTLTVTGADLATDTDEVTITVNPLPTATVSGDTSIFVGGSATISAALTGTAPWSITWSDGATQSGLASSPATRIVNPASTTTYTVTAVADANCTGTFSGSATVTVTPPSSGGEEVVLATNSVWLKESSDILSGSVIVNNASPGPVLDSQVELAVGQNVTTPAGFALKAHRIKVKQGAAVESDIFYNELENNGTINGSQNSPLTLPVFASLPPFNQAPAGTQDITVNKDESITLTAGAYRDILVKQNGEILFTGGGTFVLRSLNTGAKARLLFEAPTEILLEGKLDTDENSYVGPQSGSGIGAADIVFYVAGVNGNTGNFGATPKAAQLGLKNTVLANFYVPNGTLWLRQGTEATGAFLGRDVIVGEHVQVKLESAFESGSSLAKSASNEGGQEKLISTAVPEAFALHQNYPNPFNPSTMISFTLREAGMVQLTIYNLQGQEVRILVSSQMNAGHHGLRWDGTDNAGEIAPNGLYLYKLRANGFVQVRKMTFLK